MPPNPTPLTMLLLLRPKVAVGLGTPLDAAGTTFAIPLVIDDRVLWGVLMPLDAVSLAAALDVWILSIPVTFHAARKKILNRIIELVSIRVIYTDAITLMISRPPDFPSAPMTFMWAGSDGIVENLPVLFNLALAHHDWMTPLSSEYPVAISVDVAPGHVIIFFMGSSRFVPSSRIYPGWPSASP